MKADDLAFLFFLFLELICFSSFLMGMKISDRLKREHCAARDSDR